MLPAAATPRFLASAAALVAIVLITGVAVQDLASRNEFSIPGPPAGSDRWSRIPGDGKPVKAPSQWFFNQRAWPQGSINLEAWRSAQTQARALKDAFLAGKDLKDSAVWTQRGPTNIGGRITCIAVDPRDQDVVYAGAAEGGVMRSFDGGQNWDMLFDDQPSLAIGAIALDPVDPDIVYAGTGEVNPGGGSVAFGGTGLYRSLDQGNNWTPLGLENSGSIGRIVIDPTDPDRIFVAVMGNLWSSGQDRGVYRSEDGGAGWEQVLYVDDVTGCVDLVMRPDTPQVVFAAMWERVRSFETYDYGGPGCAVWKTSDGGDDWAVVGGGLPAPGISGGRIGLTLCRNQPDRMYAVYADNIGYFDGLFRSDDGGASWTRTNDGGLSSIFASYGWWFGNVRCHPDDPDMVFVLGLGFYRTLDGGQNWASSSGGMHVDHHGMGWGPAPDRVIYEGNDGGVYRGNYLGDTWDLLPNQPITQVYRLGLDAGNPDALYTGSQDNGTTRTLAGELDDWSSILGGDGFQPLVHPLDSQRIWAQYQYGSVYFSRNGGNSFNYAGNGIQSTDRFGWDAPHVQDPTDPDRRYFGTNFLYRNVDDTSWTVISPDLTDGPHVNPGVQVMGALSTIAVSPLDAGVIVTGSDDGQVHVTTSGGALWENVSAGLPLRWITSVRCDPFARETIYATISGLRWDEPLPHVFRSTNLGADWEPIAGNLPEAPVNDLLAHPDNPGQLFVATDLGVFGTIDGGVTWSPVAGGLPNVVVFHLAWNAARGELVAGTFGRSVYAVPIPEATPVTDQIVQAHVGRVLPAFPNPTSGGTTLAWELARAGEVTVEVFSVRGQKIYTATGSQSGGPGSLFWDGRDHRGRLAAAGVYLVRVRVNGRILGRSRAVLTR